MEGVWRLAVHLSVGENYVRVVRNFVFCTVQEVVKKPIGHDMYRQFYIQQFCVLPHTSYLCVLRRSENKQRLFPYTALTDWF
jgi:hypothetical protein